MEFDSFGEMKMNFQRLTMPHKKNSVRRAFDGQGFKHLLAQLLQHWYVLRRYAVVDAAMRGR